MLHICYAALRPHLPRNACGNIWALEKKFHFKVKRYIRVGLRGFLSLCILILEVGWLLVPLSQGFFLEDPHEQQSIHFFKRKQLLGYM